MCWCNAGWCTQNTSDMTEEELRRKMARRFGGAMEALQAKAALEAELAQVRQQIDTRVAALEAERDASAAQAQASPHNLSTAPCLPMRVLWVIHEDRIGPRVSQTLPLDIS